MEEKEKKGNQVLLAVIGVATLLVAVIGATFAFFTASGVSGNKTTNNISAQTAQYGNTTVTYDTTYGAINTGILDLKQTETGTNYQYLLKFQVSTTATADQVIKVAWSNLVNGFCQNRTGQVCNDPATSGTPVTDEIVYDFYSCTSVAYTATVASGRTVTLNAGCSKISATTSADVPVTGATTALHTAASLPLAASGTNYYALVVTIKNKDAEQNYQQGKSLSTRVVVSIPAH